MVHNSPVFSSLFCAQCFQPIQVNRKNSSTCYFPTQQKCKYVHINTERRALQLFGSVLLFCSLCCSIRSEGLGNPSGHSSRGLQGSLGCPTPALLPCCFCWAGCSRKCFSPVKWGRWHFVFTAQSAQYCVLFFLSFLKSKSNFKKLLVAQAVLLAALLLFGQE